VLARDEAERSPRSDAVCHRRGRCDPARRGGRFLPAGRRNPFSVAQPALRLPWTVLAAAADLPRPARDAARRAPPTCALSTRRAAGAGPPDIQPDVWAGDQPGGVVVADRGPDLSGP